MRIEATRRELILRAAAAGGLGAAGSALMFPAPGAAALASQPVPPATELQALLRVELLAVFCYEHVLASDLLSPRQQPVLELIASHEHAHIEALRSALESRGGTPPQGPPNVATADRYLADRHVSNRLGALQGQPDALRLLVALEKEAEGSYYVAMSRLSDAGLLRLGAEIMANEAQHYSVLRELLRPGDPQNAVPYGLVQGSH
jgi:rubrerythrin